MNQTEAPSRQIVFDLELQRELASHVFTGRKLIEVRVNDPVKWGRLESGSVLRIVSQTSREQVFMIVLDTRIYDSLEVCLAAEGVRNLLPGQINHAEACSTYLKLDGSDDESVLKTKSGYSKFGAIAFEFRPLSHHAFFQFILGTLNSDTIVKKHERYENISKITDFPEPRATYVPNTGDPACKHRHSDQTTFLPIAGLTSVACMICGKKMTVNLSKKTYSAVPMPYDDPPK